MRDRGRRMVTTHANDDGDDDGDGGDGCDEDDNDDDDDCRGDGDDG